MQSDLCFTIKDSLKSVVRALGGAKVVGHKLRPDLDPDAAGRWLLSCLEPEPKLSLGQLMLILRMGHDAGCHAGMERNRRGFRIIERIANRAVRR